MPMREVMLFKLLRGHVPELPLGILQNLQKRLLPVENAIIGITHVRKLLKLFGLMAHPTEEHVGMLTKKKK